MSARSAVARVMAWLLAGAAAACVACGGAPAAGGAGAGGGTGTGEGAGEPSAIARFHVARCGSCHTRIEPGERTRAELETALARHRKRVRATDQQWAELIDYLARKEGGTVAGGATRGGGGGT